MSDSEVLVVGAREVAAALEGREASVLDAVRKAYETHARGASALPHSSFLRFPDSDEDRIICLPAYLGEQYQLAGVKWIASMPGNVASGMERASAVIILNERVSGRPKAILEGSIISKQRTAASAALASLVLAPCKPSAIGFVGCGPINSAVARFMATTWPDTERFVAFDLEPARAEAFCEASRADFAGVTCNRAATLNELLGACPMVVFATTAIQPYVEDLDACPPGATVLHISLRDLSPATILTNHNVVDDLDHVTRAATSIHLAAQSTGNTDFVLGSLGELLLNQVKLPPEDGRKMIFSPFGLGVLDLALADLVLAKVIEDSSATAVPSFLP